MNTAKKGALIAVILLDVLFDNDMGIGAAETERTDAADTFSATADSTSEALGEP